ncbi:hypothetical protein ACEUDE_06915 [Aeromonas veronii]
MKLCLTTALLLCSISSANANTCPLSNCNTLHAGEHYSINADGKYCINFNKENITVVTFIVFTVILKANYRSTLVRCDDAILGCYIIFYIQPLVFRMI